MGLLSSFDTNRDELNTGSGIGKLIVDLSTFRIGGTPIGKAPWDGDFFAQSLLQNETFQPAESGYELGVEDGFLNYAFITLAHFQGVFLIGDQISPVTRQTTKDEIITLFGEPYWTDLDDGEIIHFYEYRAGTIELQFEFPDGQNLAFITLLKDGILSVEAQRKSYRVTKPWPPQEK
jgi:hypothetical protein